MESRNREGRPSWQSPMRLQLAGDKITKTPATRSSRRPGSDPPPQVTGVREPLPACPQSRPGRGWGRGWGWSLSPHGTGRPQWMIPNWEALEGPGVKDVRAGDGVRRVL